MTGGKEDGNKILFDEDLLILGNARHYIDELPIRFRDAVCEFLDLSVATYYRRSCIVLDFNNAKRGCRKQLSGSDRLAIHKICRAFADEFNAYADYIKPKQLKPGSKLPKGFNIQ